MSKPLPTVFAKASSFTKVSADRSPVKRLPPSLKLWRTGRFINKIKAAFFDRDGTLIEDVNYLCDLKQIKIISKIIELCLFLQKCDYKLFVVSNQSGVARGFFDESFVQKTHEVLKENFAKQKVFFESFSYCPHHPTEAKIKKYLIDCDCRKPKLGMFLKLAEDFNIDLDNSLMFGDKLIDIQAGQAAGCKSFYIQDVLTKKNLWQF